MHRNRNSVLALHLVVHRERDARPTRHDQRVRRARCFVSRLGEERHVDDRVVAERVEQREPLLGTAHRRAGREIPVARRLASARADRNVVAATQLVLHDRLTAAHFDDHPWLSVLDDVGNVESRARECVDTSLHRFRRLVGTGHHGHRDVDRVVGQVADDDRLVGATVGGRRALGAVPGDRHRARGRYRRAVDRAPHRGPRHSDRRCRVVEQQCARDDGRDEHEHRRSETLARSRRRLAACRLRAIVWSSADAPVSGDRRLIDAPRSRRRRRRQRSRQVSGPGCALHARAHGPVGHELGCRGAARAHQRWQRPRSATSSRTSR